MLKDELKDILKYVLRKSERDRIRQLGDENKIIKVHQSLKPNNGRIYIIRRLNKMVGTFSDYIVFLRAIEFAISQGGIPIIDRKTVKNIFTPADSNINTWEYFFEQPYNVDLDHIDNNMDVYVINCGANLYPASLLNCNNQDMIDYWRMVAHKYIRLTKEMDALVDSEYEKLLKGKRTLGVSIREGYQKASDIKSSVIGGHPIQATIDFMIEEVKRKLNAWNLEQVFFTCQTKETVERFSSVFGDKAVFVDKYRPVYEKLPEGKMLKKREGSKAVINNERKYITEIALLARCTSLICCHNSGSDAAFLMSDGYEHFICLDVGKTYS